MWDLGIFPQIQAGLLRVYFKQWMYIKSEGLRYDVRDGHLDYSVKTLAIMSYEEIVALVSEDLKRQYLYWDATDAVRRVCRASLCSVRVPRAYLSAGLSQASFGASWLVGKIPERYT